MRASVINRFAKNVTVAEGARRRRLAAAAPLAALVAVGLVGCTPEHPAATARPTTPAATTATTVTPSASASVSSTPSAPSAPSATDSATPSAPTTTPAATASHPAAPTKPVSRKGDGITVTFNGLDAGRKIEADGSTVSFSVTWTNDSGKRYEHIAPVVASQFYDGARCQVLAGFANGSLQRKEGASWTRLPLSQGTGMDYAMTGDNARFDLAPGASRTIEYRMQLNETDGPGSLPIEADAFLRNGDSAGFKQVGKAVRTVEVVDHHRPTAQLTAPLPNAVTIGGPAVEVETQVVNQTSAAFKWANPELLLLTDVPVGPAPMIRPEDVRVEVFWQGAWQPATITTDACRGQQEGVTVQMSRYGLPLAPGASAQLKFRFALAPSADPRLTSLTVAVGAYGDEHEGATVLRQLTVQPAQ